MAQIIDRAGRRGEMQDVVHHSVNLQRVGNVVANERETVAAAQTLDVFSIAGNKIVDADDFVTFRQEALTKMRADKPGAARNNGPHGVSITTHCGSMEFVCAVSSERSSK